MLDVLQLHDVQHRQDLVLWYEPGQGWMATNPDGRRVLLGRSLCDINLADAESAGAQLVQQRRYE